MQFLEDSHTQKAVSSFLVWKQAMEEISLPGACERRKGGMSVPIPIYMHFLNRFRFSVE